MVTFFLQKLTTGYVNITIVCSLENDTDKRNAIVIRIYGDKGDVHESHDLEFAKMQVGMEENMCHMRSPYYCHSLAVAVAAAKVVVVTGATAVAVAVMFVFGMVLNVLVASIWASLETGNKL